MARLSSPVEFDSVEEFVTIVTSDTFVTFDTIAVLVVAKGTSLEAIDSKLRKNFMVLT